jgi:beta-N-acetylhexosaminidase
MPFPRRRAACPVLFFLLCLLCLPAICLGLTKEQAFEVEKMIFSMPIEDKVGQIFMTFFPGRAYAGELKALVEDYRVGGLILYSICGNTGTPRQVVELTNAVKAGALAAKRIPPLIAVDQEGGRVARLTEGFTRFPGAMALAATNDPALAGRAARDTAEELAAVGVHLDFAPVADVNVNPANPVIGTRSFGSDPAAVSRFVTAQVAGYREGGVFSCAKHFPGHGDTSVDSHHDLPVVTSSAEDIAATAWPPFQAAMKAGVPMLMTAHIEVPAIDKGRPATMSDRLLIGMVRALWGYEGIIVTDSLLMGAIRERMDPGQAAVNAFLAGADILLFGADLTAGGHPEQGLAMQRTAIDYFLYRAREGTLPLERLNESLRRILRAKIEAGILEAKALDPAAAEKICASPAHTADALAMARASLTALGPGGSRNPAAGPGTLLVLPETAAPLAQALSSLVPGLVSLALPLDPSPADIARAVAAAGQAEGLVLALSDAARHPGQLALAAALAQFGPTQVLLESPYDLPLLPPAGRTYLTYGSVPASLTALAEALAGRLNPTGRLPVTLTVSETPPTPKAD